MKPKISVIVPVYNVANYVIQCLKSIKNQTFQDFEVIIIDDGSLDGSADLVRKFISENKLETKFHLIYKQNGGLSSARNAGLGLAKGIWIMFLDSDDWLESDALMSLDTCLQKHPSDLVIGGYQAYNNATAETEIWSAYSFSYGRLPENLAVLPSFGYCWGRLYNTQIIRENNLRFDEQVKYGEDIAWQFDYARCIHSFSCTNNVVYNYRINRGGAMTSSLVTPHAMYSMFQSKLYLRG